MLMNSPTKEFTFNSDNFEYKLSFYSRYLYFYQKSIDEYELEEESNGTKPDELILDPILSNIMKNNNKNNNVISNLEHKSEIILYKEFISIIKKNILQNEDIKEYYVDVMCSNGLSINILCIDETHADIIFNAINSWRLTGFTYEFYN